MGEKMQNLLDKSKETKNDLTDRQTDRQTARLSLSFLATIKVY